MSEESIRKLRETNIRNYGSEEAYKQAMRERGSKGGKASGYRAFRDKDIASRAGKLGAKKRWSTQVIMEEKP